MIRLVDHIVILVKDLDAAIADYRALGFNVSFGGEHADGNTHNALIPFNDGSYFELIAFKREAPDHRWWKYVQNGEGLVDYALLPSDAAEDIAGIQARGLAYTGPTAGGRLRPDGERLEWQIGEPPVAGLPFLCGDVTPRSLRVPEGDARIHANGVQGIQGLTVAVADIGKAVDQYAALLDRPKAPIAKISPLGAAIAIYEFGGTTISLVQPRDAGTPLAGALAMRGEGIAALSLSTTGETKMLLDTVLSHNVPIALVS